MRQFYSRQYLKVALVILLVFFFSTIFYGFLRPVIPFYVLAMVACVLTCCAVYFAYHAFYYEERTKATELHSSRSSTELNAVIEEQTQTLKNMMGRVSDGFFSFDEHWNFTYVNNSGASFIGRSVNELVGNNLWKLFPEAIDHPVYRAYLSAVETRENAAIEFFYEPFNKWFVQHLYPVKNGLLVFARDVTEMRTAEKNLQASEDRYRTLFESASEGIFIMDSNGRFVDVNPAGLTMLGYDKEELKSITARTVLPENEQLTSDIRKDELNTGHPVTAERRFHHKEGRWGYADVSYRQLPDGNYLAIARDVTEKKKNLEELSRTNARFQTVSKATSDIVWDWDFQSNQIWWNDNYYLHLGYPRTDIPKNVATWTDRIHPDERERVLNSVNLALAGNENVWREQYSYRKADGTYARFLDRGFILRTTDGTPVRMIGSMADMTTMFAAQRDLVESEHRLRTILDTDPDCIKLLNIDCTVADINRAGLKMVEADDIISLRQKSLLPVVVADHRSKAEACIRRTFEGETGQFQFEMIGFKGTHRWCEMNVVPFRDTQGKVMYALGVTRDISDHIKAEKELADSYEEIRKLSSYIQEIREEERTNISREIHDELGQKLTVLKMDVSWLKKKIGNADGPTQEKFTELINMLDQTVATVRRISSDLRPSLLDDLGLVAAMEWQLAEFQKRSGITAKSDLPVVDVELPNAVKTALFRIFQESLTNVVRHSEANEVMVTLRVDDDRLFLSIIDNGKGFDKELVSGKRTLGILGMKERIKMIGGVYDIKGNEGAGSEVIVEVPLNQPKFSPL